MTLDEKIRAAFKRPEKLKEVTGAKYDPDKQPNLYELDNFLRKSGYRIDSILTQENDKPEIVIEPIKKGHLYPEIIQSWDDFEFYVKVVKYGMLGSSDLEDIIIGYENALAVINHLNSIDLEKLEIDDEE